MGADPGSAGQHAADAGADLHRGSFKAQRGSGSNLRSADDEFTDRLPHGDHAGSKGVGHFDLGNSAAGGGRGEVVEADSGEQAAQDRGEDRPPDPAMPGRGVGAVDEQRFGPENAFVKGDGGQAAKSSGEDGHRQQPLPLAGQAAHQPRQEAEIQALKANPITQFCPITQF